MHNQKNLLILTVMATALAACNSGTSTTPNYDSYLYMITGDSNIQVCPAGGNQANLNGCQTIAGTGLFESPTSLAFNDSGSFAYITNSNNTVSKCNVESSGLFNNCNQMGSQQSWFSSPRSILIQGNNAYIANSNNRLATCNIESSNGEFSNCSNTNLHASFISITANGSQLYGLTSPLLPNIYSCNLNNLAAGCTLIAIESATLGIPQQLYYGNTQNLLYTADSNSAAGLGLLGGGIYGCSIVTDSLINCMTAYQLNGFQVTFPTSASIYTMTTNGGSNAYFIDYFKTVNAFNNQEQEGTYLSACNIDGNGKFTNCNSYQLSSANLHTATNGNLYITYHKKQ